MENLKQSLELVRKSIKFNKCFRDDESIALVKSLRKEESLLLNAIQQEEIAMSTQQVLARLKYQEILIKEGYSYDECANMDLVEMRDLVDEINPLVITNSSVTMRGGKTKKVTVVRGKVA